MVSVWTKAPFFLLSVLINGLHRFLPIAYCLSFLSLFIFRKASRLEETEKNVNCRTMGLVTIHSPISEINYFGYRRLLINNDILMLIGLKTKTRFRVQTDKYRCNLSITLRSLSIMLPLVVKDHHLYYEGPPNKDYLFISAELAQLQ